MLKLSLLSVFSGEKQRKLAEALDRIPPKAYLEAMEALLRWLHNNETLLISEKFCVKELTVLEEQLKQFNVTIVDFLLENRRR